MIPFAIGSANISADGAWGADGDQKVVERTGAGAALAQLRARGYADKYRHLGEPVYLVGMEFGEMAWNLARFEAERA